MVRLIEINTCGISFPLTKVFFPVWKLEKIFPKNDTMEDDICQMLLRRSWFLEGCFTFCFFWGKDINSKGSSYLEKLLYYLNKPFT